MDYKGLCTAQSHVQVYAISTPERGSARPDGAVPEGARVVLNGVAREVVVAPNCSTKYIPLPFRWVVTYRSPEGITTQLAADLKDATTLSPSFIARKGTYTVVLEIDERERSGRTGKPFKLGAFRYKIFSIQCGDWIPIGPEVAVPNCYKAGACGTGMVMSVAFDPGNSDHVFVGTRGGGVWESTDGANSWVPISDHNGLPAGLVVGRLAIAPPKQGQNSIRIFAGTGTSDALKFGNPSANGIYASDDRGVTWKLLGNHLGCARPGVYPDGTVSKIIIDPINSLRIYAAASNGVYRSDDGGDCWVNLTANLFVLKDPKAELPVYDMVLSSFAGAPALYASIFSKTIATICESVVVLPNPAGNPSDWQASFTESSVTGISRCPVISPESGVIRLASGRGDLGDLIYALVPAGDELHLYRKGSVSSWIQ